MHHHHHHHPLPSPAPPPPSNQPITATHNTPTPPSLQFPHPVGGLLLLLARLETSPGFARLSFDHRSAWKFLWVFCFENWGWKYSPPSLSVPFFFAMALSMGVAMEWSRFCDAAPAPPVEYIVSDVTDTESDGEEEELEFAAFPPVAVVGSKRTYGVFREDQPARRKRSRVDEQLELLRAAIPDLCTTEKGSILVGAYEYIEKLQRQVQELQSELDEEEDDGEEDDEEEDVRSCCEEERSVTSCAECRGDSHATVEVVQTEEGLKIHIQCAKRPHVLAEIMELLESSGMSVEQVSIAYQEDSQFLFDCLGSGGDGNGIAADSRHVEACLRSLIRDVA